MVHPTHLRLLLFFLPCKMVQEIGISLEVYLRAVIWDDSLMADERCHCSTLQVPSGLNGWLQHGTFRGCFFTLICLHQLCFPRHQQTCLFGMHHSFKLSVSQLCTNLKDTAQYSQSNYSKLTLRVIIDRSYCVQYQRFESQYNSSSFLFRSMTDMLEITELLNP